MSNELRFPDPNPDAELAAALRPLLTPPSDSAAYWDGLHRRIMGRVAVSGAATWWSISPSVARAGLVAAGLALLALGAMTFQRHEMEARLAFESATDTELEVARNMPGIDEPVRNARTPEQR